MTTSRPTIPLRVASGKPSAEALAQMDRHWRWRYVMLAPHRLGFLLAMVVLVTSGVWWALVQVDRSTQWWGLPGALPPTLVHSAVMVFGFIPLFFSGFLFTAGPKWLGVEPLPVNALRFPLLAQAAGWLLWLAGAHWHSALALAGLALACSGLVWMTAQFWGRVRLSQAQDQLHARVIASACLLGSASVVGLWLSLVLGAPAVARAWVFTGLWGFVVVVYVTVAHRMIPFFTSSAMPMVQAWRPFWVLWLMLAAALLQVLAVWLEWAGVSASAAGPAWGLVHGSLQLVVGGVLVWLACVWGLVQSLKNKLLAMLHIGFLWLGVSFLLGGVSAWLAWGMGVGGLGLGALHALTMGCLASLMLAMVTRVSCGHSGRALVADRMAWSLFWLLQAATVLRIVAAVPGIPGDVLLWLLPLAAVLWAGTMGAWGVRLGRWYGCLRADGRPG
ncbi:NnrS family protein [Acidovorax sp. D2M1]|uniref:NnrS family protein n=1 Tax=Acidovorax benzenivorans TaxID=2987520 RepID=A0ABT5RS81_9BURK|nr:NnrS family protein [Acidovorax benzenivorans]MDD2176554.1 NnrS family protein [Acidovorax benzenivorans]